MTSILIMLILLSKFHSSRCYTLFFQWLVILTSVQWMQVAVLTYCTPIKSVRRLISIRLIYCGRYITWNAFCALCILKFHLFVICFSVRILSYSKFLEIFNISVLMTFVKQTTLKWSSIHHVIFIYVMMSFLVCTTSQPLS